MNEVKKSDVGRKNMEAEFGNKSIQSFVIR